MGTLEHTHAHSDQMCLGMSLVVSEVCPELPGLTCLHTKLAAGADESPSVSIIGHFLGHKLRELFTHLRNVGGEVYCRVVLFEAHILLSRTPLLTNWISSRWIDSFGVQFDE